MSVETKTTETDVSTMKKGRKVTIVVDDSGAYGRTEERTTRIDSNGQEYVKFNEKYWKYPQEVDC